MKFKYNINFKLPKIFNHLIGWSKKYIQYEAVMEARSVIQRNLDKKGETPRRGRSERDIEER